MKRIYSISLVMLIALLCINKTSFAQTKMSLGPVIGFNYNTHSGSDVSDQLTGFGLVAGGQLDMQFNPNIGLIINLMFYDNRSATNTRTISYLDMDVSEDVTENIAYFSIEPLLKIAIPRSGFYFVFGPSIGFNEDATEEITETLPSGNQTKTKTTLNNLLARFELKFGAGCDVPISRDVSLTPQLTFGYGATNVQSDVDWKIQTLQASIVLKFRLN